jgi:signal transduction histidine kinase
MPSTPELTDENDFARERFLMRARALFFARVSLLTMGLAILLVPAWRSTFRVDVTEGSIVSLLPIAVYMAMVAYMAANYVYVERGRFGEVLTFATLCFDLVALVYLVVVSGGLQSPLLPTQLLFTMLFVMLFPRPLAIVPPLLTFPIVAYIQELSPNTSFTSKDLFLLIWYSVINCVVVYVVVYLHTREEMKHREILRLQDSLKEMAIVEERTRLAREIHDGLGGSLSSFILQAEYIQGLARDAHMRSEIADLKAQAEESIEELRRALTLMRDDFDLVRGVEDACRKFESRASNLQITFMRLGKERPVSSEGALTLFRVLQESLTNVVRHAEATQAAVMLQFTSEVCTLTVQDNGKGFDTSRPSPQGHYGLMNVVERAQRVQGTAKVESTVGQGSIVTLTVPLASKVSVRSRSSTANAA